MEVAIAEGLKQGNQLTIQKMGSSFKISKILGPSLSPFHMLTLPRPQEKAEGGEKFSELDRTETAFWFPRDSFLLIPG